MDEFSFQGYWYTPGNESEQIPGTLHFASKESIELDLFRPFDNYMIERGGGKYPTAIDTIFGVTDFGGRITLTDCEPAGHRVSKDYEQDDSITMKYQPEFGFIGEHTAGGPEFNTLSVEFTYFDKWIHHADVEDLKLTLLDGAELLINYVGLEDPKEPTFGREQEDYRLVVRLEDSVGVEEGLSEYIWPFQQILSFGLNSPVFPEYLYGTSMARERFERNATRFRGIHSQTDFAVERTSVIYSEPLRRLLPDREPFGYYKLAHIKENAEQIIQDWYDVYNKHRPLFDLYFKSIFYNDQPYPSVTLLNLTRSLESYHRESEKYSDHYIDEQEFQKYQKELNKTIKESFPEDFKNHLKHGTFRYANRLALRRRLEDLIEAHEDVLSSRLRDEIDSRKMASQIKQARNGLTHLSDENLEEFNRKAEGGLNRQVAFLIEVIIADEVGLPNEIFPLYSDDSS